MRVSFDLDGTVTAYPSIFVDLGSALRAAGHKVYILTGIDMATFNGRRKEKYPCLSCEGWYDEVLTSDLYNSDERRLAQLVIQGRLDNHVLVGVFKQRICAELGISVHFDDDVAHVRTSKGGVPVFGVS